MQTKENNSMNSKCVSLIGPNDTRSKNKNKTKKQIRIEFIKYKLVFRINMLFSMRHYHFHCSVSCFHGKPIRSWCEKIEKRALLRLHV